MTERKGTPSGELIVRGAERIGGANLAKSNRWGALVEITRLLESDS
jgi:hypothetical protein